MSDLDLTKAIDNLDECIKLVKDKFKFDDNYLTRISGYYLFPDGDIIETNPHGIVDNFLINKGYIKNNSDKPIILTEGSKFLEYLNCVRLRGFNNLTPGISYIVIPKNKLTEIQKIKLLNWLDIMYYNKKNIGLFTLDNYYKQYDYFENEIYSDEILKDIDRIYS